MMGLIGKKLGMTQLPDENGKMTPVTLLEVGPCTILDIRTKEKHGYSSLKFGFGEIPAKKLNKPILGQLKKIFGERESYPARVIREIRFDDTNNYSIGQTLDVSIFQNYKKVDVSGVTKGKGFTGVVKRWGFKGGPKSHGSMFHRRPGSVGQTTFPGRVWKGKKMAGHHGVKNTTQRNLKIFKIIPEKNLLIVKGSVPGPVNGIVIVKGR